MQSETKYLRRFRIQSSKKRALIGMFCLLCFAFCDSFAMAYEPQFADNAKKIRLRWRGAVINLALSNSLRQPANNIKPDSDVVGAVRRSLRTWEAVTNIKFVTVWSDKVSISQLDGNGDGTSLITVADSPENVAPFQGEAGSMPGRTRTFYNNRGDITEADIVLNPYQQFSTDGSFGTFDLEAALTHEIGHLLGLDHSAVLAATMYAQQGKNGTFSLPAFAPRTLSEDDRAGIRSLYGTKVEEEACCGTIAGTVTSVDNKSLANWQVWAEDSTTGRLLAAVTTNDNGVWKLGGLPNGKYRIVAQKDKFSAEILGEATVENDKTAILNHKFLPRSRSFNITSSGYNGQLSTLAVSLNAGRWHTMFLGGENLTFKNLDAGSITTGSTFLRIAHETLTAQDFAASFPINSFNIYIDSDAPLGEYSLRVQNSAGETAYLLGCISVDQY